MSSLLEQLQSIDPAITATHAAELRVGLVALNQQAQAEPASAAWSLNRWWQWLDEEGYSRDVLLDTLNSLGLTATGQHAWDQLTDHLRSHAEDSQGLLMVQEALEQQDPELPAVLHNLEAMAIAEDLELAQTAGGMRKAVKDTLYGVAGVVGAVAIGCIGKAWSSHVDRRALREKAAAGLERQANEAERKVADAERQGRQDLIREEEKFSNEMEDLMKEGTKNPSALQRALKGTDLKVVSNEKDILAYTEDDLEVRAETLLANHIKKFENETVRFIDNQIASKVKDTPEFKDRVIKAAESEVDIDDFAADLGSDITPEARAKAEQEVMNGEWFAKLKQEVWKDNATRLRSEFTKKVKTAYKSLLRKEIATARVEARGESPFIDAVIGDEKDFVQFSKVKIDKDILRIAEEADAAALDAERAAKDSKGLL